MLFMEDLVICEHSRAQVELQLERWRETFASHGLRVSRGKTEYMPENDQTIYIQESEVKTVQVSGLIVWCQRRIREKWSAHFGCYITSMDSKLCLRDEKMLHLYKFTIFCHCQQTWTPSCISGRLSLIGWIRTLWRKCQPSAAALENLV